MSKAARFDYGWVVVGAGALIVLVFAMAQGLYAAGIASTLVMARRRAGVADQDREFVAVHPHQRVFVAQP